MQSSEKVPPPEKSIWQWKIHPFESMNPPIWVDVFPYESMVGFSDVILVFRILGIHHPPSPNLHGKRWNPKLMPYWFWPPSWLLLGDHKKVAATLWKVGFRKKHRDILGKVNNVSDVVFYCNYLLLGEECVLFLGILGGMFLKVLIQRKSFRVLVFGTPGVQNQCTFGPMVHYLFGLIWIPNGSPWWQGFIMMICTWWSLFRITLIAAIFVGFNPPPFTRHRLMNHRIPSITKTWDLPFPRN